MEAHITSGPAAEQLPAPSESPAGTLTAGQTAAGRDGRATRWRVPSSWPLLPVLVVQALLSLRLVRADTAFQDEALYLWAGHLQWAHWLHGTAIPPFAYYFSGAPVIYPPLGALADHAGGPGRGPGPVPGLHARGDHAAVERRPAAVRARGPRSSPRRCSRCWARPCTWARSPPTTPCRCSWSRWPPGACCGPATAGEAPAG